MRAKRTAILADIFSSMIVTGVLRGSAPRFERSHTPAACVKGVAESSR